MLCTYILEKLLTLFAMTNCCKKIKSFDINFKGALFKWFVAYLSHRSQYVHVNKSFSDLLPVLSGVLYSLFCL